MFTIIGLGNPGEEYKTTRHNAGRMAVEEFAKKNKFPAWIKDQKTNALKSEAKPGKEKLILLLPETFMNNSGNAVEKIISSPKKARQLIVAHDDLDLPLGKFKISFDRSSAGHRGVESIIKKLKTNEFIRIRVGIAPKSKAKNKDIVKFLMAKFPLKDILILKKVFKKTSLAIEEIANNGLAKAMNSYNQQ